MTVTTNDTLDSALSNYPVIHTQAVAWGDMDALSHVNNVVYYRYAESARLAYLYKLGMFDSDSALVLAQSTCNYLRPVHFPDTLQIGTRCKKLGNTSIIFEYVFYSTAQQAVVATAEAVIVNLDKTTQTKLAWTDEQRQSVMDIESKVNEQT